MNTNVRVTASAKELTTLEDGLIHLVEVDTKFDGPLKTSIKKTSIAGRTSHDVVSRVLEQQVRFFQDSLARAFRDQGLAHQIDAVRKDNK